MFLKISEANDALHLVIKSKLAKRKALQLTHKQQAFLVGEMLLAHQVANCAAQPTDCQVNNDAKHIQATCYNSDHFAFALRGHKESDPVVDEYHKLDAEHCPE